MAHRKRRWSDVSSSGELVKPQVAVSKASSSVADSKALAEAAAARINALIQAKGAAAPPVSEAKSTAEKARDAVARINAIFANKTMGGGDAGGQRVDINDCDETGRTRLTRGSFLRELEDRWKVSVSVRGRYVPPGTDAPAGESRLHILVRGDPVGAAQARRTIETVKAQHGSAPPAAAGKPQLTHMAAPAFVSAGQGPAPSAPGAGQWAWGKGPAKPVPSAALPPTQLTQRGLAAAGIASGPVVGVNEARGLMFGLHRQNFTKKKTIKLLIGIEVKLAEGFPLVQRITGQQNSFFIHIMQQCPGTLLTLHGAGSNNGGDEQLHIRIFGKVDENLTKAKTMANDLVSNVRKQFKVWKLAQLKLKASSYPTQHQQNPPQPLINSAAPHLAAPSMASVPWASLATKAPTINPAAVAAIPPSLPNSSTPAAAPISAATPNVALQPMSHTPNTLASAFNATTNSQIAHSAQPQSAVPSLSRGGREEEYDPLAAGSDSD